MFSRRLLTNSALIAFLFGLDKVIGFLLQRLTAQAFGLGAELDAFNAANNAPDTLFALISGGALAMALIPLLTETLDQQGSAAFWDLFARVANLAVGGTAVLALGLALFAEPLVQHVIVPGFAPARQTLVVELLRLNLIATLIFSFSGLVMGALHARQHFLLPALAPIFYNLGQTFGALVLAPHFGVQGLVYGVILGAVAHLAIQVPGLWRYGFRWTPRLDWRSPAVQRVLALMGPRVLTLLCINLVFIFNDRQASALGEGPISALALGWRLMQLPETLLGTALATALLPTLAEMVTRHQIVELRALLRRTLGLMFLVTAITTLISWWALPPLIQLVFEGRAFAAEDTALVVLTTRLLMLGLVGHALKEVTARTFYAYQDARTPVITALFTLGIFMALSLWLLPSLGAGALALANSVAFTLEAGVMLAILWRRGIL